MSGAQIAIAAAGAGIAYFVHQASELDILARTIWGEARGEGASGMAAVAAVIMNRVRSPAWPNTIRGVVLQPWQFSMWNKGDPNGAQAMAVTEADPAFRTALAVAVAAMGGADPTGGANHYHADSVVPKWASAMQKVGAIGNHIFYRG